MMPLAVLLALVACLSASVLGGRAAASPAVGGRGAAAAVARAASSSSSAAAAGRNSKPASATATRLLSDNDVLIVSTLDGAVVGLDARSGRQLWTADTGAPLVSARHSAASPVNVFPAADGGLYAYHGGGGGGHDQQKQQHQQHHHHQQPFVGLERLPLTLPDLVEAAPSVAPDGSMVVGSRRSRILVLDQATGALLRTISADGGDEAVDDLEQQQQQQAASAARATAVGLSAGSSVVYVGRQDYTVRSVRLDTQTETWNATYSRVFPLGNASLSAFLRSGGGGGGGGGGGILALPSSAAASSSSLSPSAFPRLVATSDNSIQAYDPATGRPLWRAALAAPPVLAQTRGGLGADFLARQAPRGGGGGAAAATALGGGGALSLPALDVSTAAASPLGGTVLVGVLQGSLYVLPADNLLISDGGAAVPGLRPRGHGVFGPRGSEDGGGGDGAAGAAASAAESAAEEAPADDAPLLDDVCVAPELQEEDDASDSQGSRPPGGMALPEAPLGGLADTLGSLVCPTPALGLHSVRAAAALGPLDGDAGWAAAGATEHHDRQAPPSAAAVLLPGGGAGGAAGGGGVTTSTSAPPALPWLPDASVLAKLAEARQQQQQQQLGQQQPPLLLMLPPGASPRDRAVRAALTAVLLLGAALVFVMPLLVLLAVVAVRNAALEVASEQQQQEDQQQGKTVARALLAVARVLARRAGLMPLESERAPSLSSPAPSSTPSGSGGTAGLLTPTSAGGKGKQRRRRPPDDGEQAEDEGGGADEEEEGDEEDKAKEEGAAAAATAAASEPRASFVDPDDGAVVIGRLRVGPKAIGYGSAGTIVYEGVLDGRPVAVKRLLRQFYDLARKEIGVLILSDEHPAVVRCFAMEEDREFVYLALERCKGSLSDYVSSAEGAEALAPVLRSAAGTLGARAAAAAQAQARVAAAAAAGAANGGGGNGAADASSSSSAAAAAAISTPAGAARPSPTCLALMRDVSEGLAALHDRGVVHRDLKPGNVLLTAAGRAKLSDMGLSRQLTAEQSSFESHGAAGGTSGWQAPEQLALRSGMVLHQGRLAAAGGGGPASAAASQHHHHPQHALPPLSSLGGRQTRAMDVFSLGCLLHFCMTGGRHPFGESFERDANILRGRADLRALARGGYPPEAANLVSAALARVPAARPTMPAVLDHPFWWIAEKRVQFLVDVSDRVEGEDREPDTTLLASLERFARAAFGRFGGGGGGGADGGGGNGGAASTTAAICSTNWGARVDARLVANLGRYRRYDFTALRDLLRVVRNKRNHFREMPQDLQADLGPMPEGFDSYFTSAFPSLVMAVFCFAATSLADDPLLSKYWPCGTAALAPFVQVFVRAAGVVAVVAGDAPPAAGGAAEGGTLGLPPLPGPAGNNNNNNNNGHSRLGGGGSAANGHHRSPPLPPLSPQSGGAGGRWAAGGGGSSGGSGGNGAAAGNGRPSDGASWRQQTQQPLPPSQDGHMLPSPSPADARRSSTNGAYTPARGSVGGAVSPGAAAAAGDAAAQPTTADPLVVGYAPDPAGTPLVAPAFPQRPGRNPCDFFVKTGHCKYAAECVFDHPDAHRVLRNERNGLPFRPSEPLCAFYGKTGGCKFGPACKFNHPALVPLYAGQLSQQHEQEEAAGAGAVGAEATAAGEASG
jgi:serine/threonine-protein kinase/endoribonuclease IRE1